MSRWLAPAKAYAEAFERLSPQTLPALGAFFADEARFRDPFNDVRGRERILAVFRHMYETIDDARFSVLDVAASGEGAYLKWRMTFRMKARAEVWTIDGLSEVAFAEDGRVAAHIDHWDAASQLYEKVPGLGALMRLLRRRLSAKV